MGKGLTMWIRRDENHDGKVEDGKGEMTHRLLDCRPGDRVEFMQVVHKIRNGFSICLVDAQGSILIYLT